MQKYIKLYACKISSNIERYIIGFFIVLSRLVSGYSIFIKLSDKITMHMTSVGHGESQFCIKYIHNSHYFAEEILLLLGNLVCRLYCSLYIRGSILEFQKDSNGEYSCWRNSFNHLKMFEKIPCFEHMHCISKFSKSDNVKQNFIFHKKCKILCYSNSKFVEMGSQNVTE